MTDAQSQPAPTATTRRSATVVADGARLATERIEPAARNDASGATMVFLHEGLGSIALWRDAPDRLAAMTGLPAVAYDRRGYGRSDPALAAWTPDYLRHEAEIVLPEVLQVLGIERPILVGHSDGASIALLYAAAFPDRPRAVVSMAAHVEVDDLCVSGIRAARQAYAATDLRQKLARYHGANTDTVFANWSGTWLSDAFASWQIRDRLPAITAPVLAIQGADDEYGRPRQLALIAAGVAGPCESHLIPACRHVPHLQAAERVLPLIAAFVRRHAEQGSPQAMPS